ncbi:MAG TPA: DMT family transporter [Puia sp.]|nr:DMT family transporter [Puia sp.]
MKKRILQFGAGFGFSVLWASASTATKLGLQAAQPFMICITRFFLAAILMLGITHGLLGNRLPRGAEWKQLAIYGLLNISIYLGLYVIAMQHVSPGLGSLSVATSPVLINLFSSLVFRQPLKGYVIVSLLLCSAGVVLAAWPLLQNSSATPGGLLTLVVSMLAYSGGVLYFSRKSWNDLPMLTINGWQTLLGGLFLLPFVAFTYRASQNTWNGTSIASVLWLAIPVSVIAIQLWLYLLKDDAAKASFWLFLCPVFGFVIAAIVMGEPIGVYTVTGMGLVIGGLYIVQRNKNS